MCHCNHSTASMSLPLPGGGAGSAVPANPSRGARHPGGPLAPSSSIAPANQTAHHQIPGLRASMGEAGSNSAACLGPATAATAATPARSNPYIFGAHSSDSAAGTLPATAATAAAPARSNPFSSARVWPPPTLLSAGGGATRRTWAGTAWARPRASVAANLAVAAVAAAAAGRHPAAPPTRPPPCRHLGALPGRGRQLPAWRR